MQDLIIYGAGGFAREVAWLAAACVAPYGPFRVVALLDDEPARHGSRVNDIPVMGLEHAVATHSNARYVIAVGGSADRARLAQRVAATGLLPTTLIHPNVQRSQWIDIGAGTVICAGSILTTNIRVGQHVQINLGCTIGHDAVLDDFVTLAPGVHVSGWAQIRQRAYIGTGAVLLGTQQDPIIVGEDAVIGAGAVVTRSVAAGVTVVGVPARPLQA